MGGNSFNPLAVILKENKLTGPNYIDWKRNLNLVLTAQEYKFVLTEVCPPPPLSFSMHECSTIVVHERRVTTWSTRAHICQHELIFLCGQD